MVKKGQLIVFSAPSGSGKTTIVKEMLKIKDLKLKFSVSATSRKKRENEIHGKDYFFLTVEDFKQKIKINEFVEWEEVYKNQFYGTLKSEVERIRNAGYNVILDIDVMGGINIKKKFADDVLTIFIMPPSIKELENRLRNRGTDNEASIQKRLSKAETEIGFADKFDKIIINDDLQTALNDTKTLLLKLLDNNLD